MPKKKGRSFLERAVEAILGVGLAYLSGSAYASSATSSILLRFGLFALGVLIVIYAVYPDQVLGMTKEKTKQKKITIQFPEGIKSKHVAIIAIYAFIVYFLIQALQSIFTSGFQNTNYALIAIAFILVVLCLITVYVVRTLSKENND